MTPPAKAPPPADLAAIKQRQQLTWAAATTP